VASPWRPRAVYLTYRGLAGALQVFPPPVASAVASAAGWTISELWRSKRPMLRSTFRRVLGPEASEEAVERCVEGAFSSYAHYWVEAARLVALSRERLLADWSIEGIEHLDDGLAQGKGVVIALPHLGNWEYGGRALAEQGYPMAAVAEVLQPPELFRWFAEQREQLGISIIPLQEGTSAAILKALSANKIVCLLSDRDLGGNGVPVQFFGEETTLPAGPAALALRGKATLVTAAVYHYPGKSHFAVVNPPIDCTRTDSLRDDVARVMRQVAAELEVHVRRAPEQWHMFQPNWPSDREPAG
jgi:phosphatidylinositol dimannoside acyltransferase